MNQREMELAATLLESASGHYADHGCTDYTLPESWTRDECDEFTLAMATWNGDPENHEPGRRMTMDWFAMAYVAAQLRTASELQQ